MNIKSKNKFTKRLTLPVQCIKLLVMRRALLTLAIAVSFIATSSAQPSRKKPQYKSTAKQTEVVKEQPKKPEPSKVKKEQPQKKSETRQETKQEAPRKSKETDRFIDKDNNGANDLTEKDKKKEKPDSFLKVIEKLLKKIKGTG